VGVLLVALNVRPAFGESSPVAAEAGNPPAAEGRTGAQPGAAPQTGPVNPQDYRLGPGDALTLVVWGAISLTQTLEVGPEGQVFVPGAGSIPVSGLTLAAARRRLEELVASQYRGVHIEVRLMRVRTLIVYLTGEVTRPGPVRALGSSRVVDVLADSLLQSGASRRNVVLRHSDGSQSIVDLGGFYLTGSSAGDSWLRDGDVIYVPPEVASVGVWGGVARAGRYELGPQDSLRTLVRIAGGLLPSALRDSTLFVHWSDSGHADSTWIAVADVESGAFNPALNDRDNFYVFLDPAYRVVHQVSLVGQVVRAGDYVIQPGVTRFSDVVRRAGGFRPEADIASIQLLRLGTPAGRHDPDFDRLVKLPRESMTESEYGVFRTKLAAMNPEIRIDWHRIVKGPVALDPVLEAGDVLRINRISNTIRVEGEVRNPGVFEYRGQTSYAYYVDLAGGYTSRARASHTRVTREVNGQSVLARNLKWLEPGDFVWVPERSDKTLWQYVSEILVVAGSVATIVIAYRR
jgi:protein involved in polysaccharide export with SLBB domain